MGWENRGNRKYYYRKKRVGRRVVSEYMGTEFSASLLSAQDDETRGERHLARVRSAQQQNEICILETNIEHMDTIICDLVRTTLLISGYRPHKGQWRKMPHV